MILELLLELRRHPQSRVSAKVVYNEFINDKNHIHMNSTKWLTLTEFVKYLGRTGRSCQARHGMDARARTICVPAPVVYALTY